MPPGFAIHSITVCDAQHSVARRFIGSIIGAAPHSSPNL